MGTFKETLFLLIPSNPLELGAKKRGLSYFYPIGLAKKWGKLKLSKSAAISSSAPIGEKIKIHKNCYKEG